MSESRFDNHPIKITDKIGANGYLTLRAIITRAGVLKYRQADGRVIRELRHPDEVFKPESLNTLKHNPLIPESDHIKCLQDGTPVNQVSEFTQLGVVGDQLKRTDRDEVEGNITVYIPDTIQKIDSDDEAELSAGYTVDVIKESGTFKGESFDQKQTNIIYGHVAVVRRGRAGSTCRFRIDSKAAILSTETQQSKQEDSVGDKNTIIKKEIPALIIGEGENAVRLDSLLIEETKESLGLLAQRNTLITAVKQSNARCDRATGEKDQLKSDNEKLKKELDGSIPASRLDAEIEEGAKLSKMCEEFRIDTKGKTNVEKKKAICLVKNPKLDEKRLDGDYLAGVFDPIESNWDQVVKDHKTLNGVYDSLENGGNDSTAVLGQSGPLKYDIKSQD